MINLTMQRYNIALIPENKTYYESLSKKYYKISEYKVGQTSIPHITIAQFYEDRESVVREIYSQVYSLANTYKEVVIHLTTSIYKFEEQFTWLELRLADPEFCNILHRKIVNILDSFDIKCLNTPFMPHLTIAKIITDKEIIENFSQLKIDQSDNFTLFMGHSDSIGQFTSVL